MVDNVCLYEARVEHVRNLHTPVDNDSQSSGDLTAIIDEKISKIPLNPIPGNRRDVPEVNVTNELGFPAGRFGWCVCCRQSANYYWLNATASRETKDKKTSRII